MPKYCIDTSVLINAWTKHYRPKRFKPFWDFMARSIDDGTVLVPREVYEEIERQDDDLHAWLKEREKLVVDPTEDVITALKAIMQDDYQSRIVKPRNNRSGGDPWVIAHAKTWMAAVVSEENRGGKDPRIPDVCDKIGVRHMRTSDFLDEMEFSL